ncbi:hypothetical protein [Rubinisphaera sp.]|uniref:hypothetical protein n=1 Tax=Rubinisphaera sp. TaxID=2024857 RepID=UPI000C10070A|nr:hypothetical protein [Rubinisphaera sp.]MBV10813.1 hypothetical protein [Rubinisphaera sp.]HCS54934.1 hypothetical protein [Planctomycetaceae bacterium]
MNSIRTPLLMSIFALAVFSTCLAQPEITAPDPVTTTEAMTPEGTSTTPTLSETTEDAVEKIKDSTKEAIDLANKKSEEIAKQVDESEQAQEYSAGVLEPIYKMAEFMSFSWFHWLAFTFMVSGVVSFALQLVLAKLAVLMHGGFSLAQILTDSQGLIISLVGLILTTQAATENSTFTNSPAAVLSATAVGVIAGFLFYLWGQSEELQALRGRKEEERIEKAKKK